MNLAHIIDGHTPWHIAIVSRGVETTYGQLRADVAKVRGGLAKLGVGPDDRVALLCGNGLVFVEAYLAVLGLGAVVVPLNPQSPSPEIQQEIATAGATVVVGRACRRRCLERTRPSRDPVGAPRHRDTRMRRRCRTELRRPRCCRAGRHRRGGARLVGGADLHQRHRRLSPRCDAQSRQSAGEHPARSIRGGAHQFRRCRLRRVADVPHLRAQRRARPQPGSMARPSC